MWPSLIEIGSKTAEKNSAQTNRQTDITKIMVTWPWTNYYTAWRQRQLGMRNLSNSSKSSCNRAREFEDTQDLTKCILSLWRSKAKRTVMINVKFNFHGNASMP